MLYSSHPACLEHDPRLEGGYEIPSLVESVLETMGALGGQGSAPSAAPEQILTPRAAKQVALFWQL